MYKICIIIPCWHNADLSKMAIHSALEVESSYVIAINNNSPDDGKTLELFDGLEESSFSNLLLVRNEENLGWVGGINQGVKLMPHCEYVCFLNNDAVLPRNFTKKIISHFRKNIGAVGPVSNCVSGIQKNNIRFYPKHHTTNFLIGFCMVIKRDVLKKVGDGLDTDYGWGGHDDLDISLRIRREGYELAVARDVYVAHVGSQAVKKRFFKEKNDPQYEKITNNYEVFRDKWGDEALNDIFKFQDHRYSLIKLLSKIKNKIFQSFIS